jgi:glycosyltransferase involved in cell wall biosynthesis
VPVVVHTKHGRNFVKQPFEHPKVQIYGHLLSWITDKIVTVSKNARDVCRYYELVPPSKILTIENGVDVARFGLAVDRPGLLRELGIPPDAHILGSVARFVAEKDHATLVHAFSRVAVAVPTAHLIAVGDGPLLDPVAQLCHELGVASRVKLVGRRPDVPTLLKSFDVFALSSITEGTSISALEAMSAGVPIVATAVGGNPELVTHGVTGLLCPPRDPARLAARVVEVMRDPALGRALAAAAREKVIASYSLERTAAAYAALYEDLLTRKCSA